MELNYVGQVFVERIREAVRLIDSCQFEYVEYGIFGSVARGNYTAMSDLDIVMVCDVMPDSNKVTTLRHSLEDINCDFALIYKCNFENPKNTFHKEIRRDYRRIKCYGE